ncbi:MAG: ferritin [Bacteroidota bacterium]
MQEENRYKCAISKESEKLLNQQVAMEGHASADYLAMASWCDVAGYKHAASFMYNQSEEERAHMLKLFHYINEVGGHALQPELRGIQHTFQSLREVCELILAQEVKVTRAIHGLVDHCLASKDYATFNFMQWFVTEQIEEESTSRRLLEFFDVIGETGVGLYMIDKEIGSLRG